MFTNSRDERLEGLMAVNMKITNTTFFGKVRPFNPAVHRRSEGA
jgi:hypothetical protein